MTKADAGREGGRVTTRAKAKAAKKNGKKGGRPPNSVLAELRHTEERSQLLYHAIVKCSAYFKHLEETEDLNLVFLSEMRREIDNAIDAVIYSKAYEPIHLDIEALMSRGES